MHFILASFTNLDVDVSVDHSTNIGAVIYTLMNGNDARGIEMDTSTSGSYGLNPANDREYLVQRIKIEFLRKQYIHK